MSTQDIFRVLHVGDFRWRSVMAEEAALQGCPLDVLFLDTTYANPRHDHPPQVYPLSLAFSLHTHKSTHNSTLPLKVPSPWSYRPSADCRLFGLLPLLESYSSWRVLGGLRAAGMHANAFEVCANWTNWGSVGCQMEYAEGRIGLQSGNRSKVCR